MTKLTSENPSKFIDNLLKLPTNLCDIDHLIHRCSNGLSIWCLTKTEPREQVSYILTKLLTDNDILKPPSFRSGDADPNVLPLYFEAMPTIGILYASRNNQVVSLSESQLRGIWRSLFRKSTLYELLLPRYKSWEQPLVEVHTQSQIIEQLCQRIYKRKTAYTEDLVVANLVCVAFLLFRDKGKSGRQIRVVTPPNLKIIK